ncbi:amidohydrolase [Ideonella sp.]|uniref:amidohydrolase n=1 Tax=Ideonella sp. TaxID=1929293 RepID=UPI0035B0F72D
MPAGQSADHSEASATERKETSIVPSQQRTPFRRIPFKFAASVAVLALGGLAGCLGWGDDRPEPATMVLRGGTVRTMDAQGRTATAVAVRGERIVAVGSDAEVSGYIGHDTQVIELKGRTLLPGFIDSHIHPAMGAERLAQCSVDGVALGVDEIVAYALSDCLPTEPQPVPAGKWIEIANVNPTNFVATAADLDRISATRPVALHGIDGHTEWVNSKALQLAGITAVTVDPPGGQIERDAHGNPTGFLKDAAQGLVDSIIPPLTLDERVALAQQALDIIRSKGITSVQDAWASESALQVYETLEAAGTLKMRVRAALMSDIVDDEAEYQRLIGLRAKYATHPLIQADAVKIFSDGVIEYPTQTAAMIKPYLDEHGQPTTNHGGRYFDQAVLNRYVARLDKEGFTIHTHSIGDYTTHAVLDALEVAKQANGATDNRHQIAHLQIVDPADFARFKALGVYANMQLFWAQPDEYSIDAVQPYILPETHRYMYPAGSLKAAGATLVGGSDWPVDALPGDPMPNTPMSATQIAVTRTGPFADSPYVGQTLHAEEVVPVADMIAAYTVNAAQALRLDSKVGTIEVGKLADFVVLDHDPYTTPADQLMQVAVTHTVFNGGLVYDAANLAASSTVARRQRAATTLQALAHKALPQRVWRDHSTHAGPGHAAH